MRELETDKRFIEFNNPTKAKITSVTINGIASILQ